MDLNTVTTFLRPSSRPHLPAPTLGDAWLAGGTWLFSEPQRHLTRLIDLDALGWEPLVATNAGLSIAATCPVSTLEQFEAPAGWRAADLIGQCCHSFLASFKVQGVATVGGNLCLALPAGPMIALCMALDGVCTTWLPGGGERRLSVGELVVGPQRNALAPGELLRGVDLPAEGLTRRTAFRRISLTPLGRSAALLIGTLSDKGAFALTVTASTRRPVCLAFPRLPSRAELSGRVRAEIPDALYFDDVHGAPDWRRHMTLLFAEEIRAELA